MAMIHVNRSGATLGVFEEEKVREGLSTGEFIGTDLGWMEGMPTWRPLSELEEFPRAAASATTGADGGCRCSSGRGSGRCRAVTTARTGLPWENRERGSMLNALIDTLMMVLTRPGEAFSIMKREGDFVDPLIYAMIMGIVGALVGLGFSLIMNSFGFMGDRRSGIGALFGMGIAFDLLCPSLYPSSFSSSFSFVGAAITHVCLMIVGGANQPFETTFRVLCYAGGSSNALQLIPVCGGLLAWVGRHCLELHWPGTRA